MTYKAILFDMDGTLLPMDIDVFFRGYMKELVKKLAFTGIDPEKLVGSVWKATQCMVENDGTKSNKEVFWENFERMTGCAAAELDPITERFYSEEFHNARVCTGENPRAAEAVRAARACAEKVILATNPLFPMTAQKARLSWLGLAVEDFDGVTAFENSHYSKPNPKYYEEVCRVHDLKPEECLMIGNDEKEDMQAAKASGMNCYLVTDWMISREECPWDGPKGTFAEMIDYLKCIRG